MTRIEYIAHAAHFMETTGVVAMLAGTVIAGVVTVRRCRTEGGAAAYPSLRKYLGRAILLGLEFLVAADIIRTVSETPTMENMGLLVVIVLIRTFLSFALEAEIEGRWPWQSQGK
jgi:uncharacterized membrane protein